MNPRAIEEITKNGCCICCEQPAVITFVKNVYSGGEYKYFNMIPLCYDHADMQKREGTIYMIQHYKTYCHAIERKGWTLDKSLKHSELRIQ